MNRETPAQLGYRMPAEWARHEATWLSWPKDTITFPGRAIDQVERNFCDAIRALVRGEKVRVLVDDEQSQLSVKSRLKDNGVPLGNVEFYRIPSIDVWTRDYAPTFVKCPKGVAAVKWKFNAWGRKYPALYPDEKAGLAIAEAAGVPIFKPGIVMEGGAIDSNGVDTLLTTEQCLLNPNRNPRLSKSEIARYLQDFTGLSNIVWLKGGIVGDDTDGHVDDVARFTSANTIACAYEHDKSSRNYRMLRRNYELLKEAQDESGELFDIVRIQMPPPMIFPKRGIGESDLPASYLNFLVANSAVLVPVFGHHNDDEALDILKSLFKGREIVPLYSTAFVYGGGAIHCASQQQPA